MSDGAPAFQVRTGAVLDLHGDIDVRRVRSSHHRGLVCDESAWRGRVLAVDRTMISVPNSQIANASVICPKTVAVESGRAWPCGFRASWVCGTAGRLGPRLLLPTSWRAAMC